MEPIEHLILIARKDWVMIAVCLVTILIHMALLYNSQAYADQCNTHWQEQLEDLDCRRLHAADPFNGSLKLLLPGQTYEDSQDNSKDS